MTVSYTLMWHCSPHDRDARQHSPSRLHIPLLSSALRRRPVRSGRRYDAGRPLGAHTLMLPCSSCSLEHEHSRTLQRFELQRVRSRLCGTRIALSCVLVTSAGTISRVVVRCLAIALRLTPLISAAHVRIPDALDEECCVRVELLGLFNRLRLSWRYAACSLRSRPPDGVVTLFSLFDEKFVSFRHLLSPR